MNCSASTSWVPICATLSVLVASSGAASGMPDKCLNYSAYPASDDLIGANASPKVGKSSPGYKYRTLVRQHASDPPNFAGHLQIVEFGCGSDCHLLLIIDKKTGDVWRQKANQASAALGYGYNIASRLLVADPPEDIEQQPAGGLLRSTVKSISYVWDEPHHVLRPLSGCDGYHQAETRTK